MSRKVGLAVVFPLTVVVIAGIEGFVTPPIHHRHHLKRADHGSSLCNTQRTRRLRPRRMNGAEGSSKKPSRDGIDKEGIDAKSTDTAGIYGFAREIVEKEEASAPFRRLRLIGYAVPAFIAIFLAGISLAGMAGLDEFKEAGENLPNPLVDAGIIGLAFYLWVEEVKTKRSSLALLKKEYEEQSKVPNRSARRQKKYFGKKKGSAAAAAAAAATAAVATTKEEPPSSAPETSPQAASTKGGLFEGVKETLDAVNKQSYYQALALNKELEEKGVLPPLQRKPTPTGGDGERVEGADEEPELTAAAAGEDVAGGREGAVAPQGGESRRRRKGKGGKKGKRGK